MVKTEDDTEAHPMQVNNPGSQRMDEAFPTVMKISTRESPCRYRGVTHISQPGTPQSPDDVEVPGVDGDRMKSQECKPYTHTIVGIRMSKHHQAMMLTRNQARQTGYYEVAGRNQQTDFTEERQMRHYGTDSEFTPRLQEWD